MTRPRAARALARVAALSALGAVAVVGCAASGVRHEHATRPERTRGCPMRVVGEGAPEHIENIGPVRASCDREDPDDVCLRELKDQACLLGGDVLWQIDGPVFDGDKKRFSGRAAHTLP